MLLSAHETAIRTRTGLSSSDGSITTAVLDSFINSALRRVASEKDWYWLEASESISLTNGTDTYTTAATSVRTIVLIDANGTALDMEPLEKVLRNVGSAATPNMFCRFGATLIVRPTPNTSGTLSHRYVRGEVTLASDSDTQLLPAVWDDAVTEYACYLVNLRLGRPDAAAANLAAYTGWVQQMKARADRYADTHGGGDPA